MSNMSKRKRLDNQLDYEDLAISPRTVAIAVCCRPYTGQELSMALRSSQQVAMIEGLRAKMTARQIEDFAKVCESRCRVAYSIRSSWFERIVSAKDNAGRDMLYVWSTHWLAAYLVKNCQQTDKNS